MADFVGTNNLLDGQVVDEDGAELVVKTSLGPLRAIAGAAIAGAVRPRDPAREHRGRAGGRGRRARPVTTRGGTRQRPGNVVAGRVAFISYLGNTLRYDIETAAGPTLKADIRDPWHHEPLALGCDVVATFPGSVTLAVAADV